MYKRATVECDGEALEIDWEIIGYKNILILERDLSLFLLLNMALFYFFYG